MNKIKNAIIGNRPFYVLAGCSIALLIGGFLCPPLAYIDKSVLYGSGEILAWGALFTVLRAIDSGLDTTLKHRDFEINVSKNGNGDNDD